MADSSSGLTPEENAYLDALIRDLRDEGGPAIYGELQRRAQQGVRWAQTASLVLAREGAQWACASDGVPEARVPLRATALVNRLVQQLDGPERMAAHQILVALTIDGATRRTARHGPWGPSLSPPALN